MDDGSEIDIDQLLTKRQARENETIPQPKRVKVDYLLDTSPLELECKRFKNDGLLDKEVLSETSDGEDSLLPVSLLEKAVYSESNGVAISKTSGFEFDSVILQQVPSSHYSGSDVHIKLPSLNKLRKEMKKSGSNTKKRPLSVVKRYSDLSVRPVNCSIYKSKWWEEDTSAIFPWNSLEYSVLHYNSFSLFPTDNLLYENKVVPLNSLQRMYAMMMRPYWNPRDQKIVHAFQKEVNRLGSHFDFKEPFSLDFSHLSSFEISSLKNRESFIIINNEAYFTKKKVISPRLDTKTYSLSFTYPEIISLNVMLDTPIPACPLPGHNWDTIYQNPHNSVLITDKNHTLFSLQALDVIAAQAKKTTMTLSRGLAAGLHGIRKWVKNHLTDQDTKHRQMATMFWMHDHFGFELFIGIKNVPMIHWTMAMIAIHGERVVDIHSNANPNDFYRVEFNTDAEQKQVFDNLSDFWNSENPKGYLFPQTNLSTMTTLLHSFVSEFELPSFSIYQYSKLAEKVLKKDNRTKGTINDLMNCAYLVAEALHQNPIDLKIDTTVVEEYYILKEEKRELKIAKKRVKKGKKIKLLSVEELDFLTKPVMTFEEEEALMKEEFRKTQEKRSKEIEEYEKALANGETPTALTHVTLNENEWKTKWFDELNIKKRKEELERKRLMYRFSRQPTLMQVKEKLSTIKKQTRKLERKICEYVDMAVIVNL